MYSRILRRFSTISYNKSKTVNIPAPIFYKAVVNVQDYKEFVPLNEDSQIVTKVNDNEFFGKLTINFKLYKGSFISRVTHKYDEDKKTYKVVSTCKESQMLKTLESIWSIRAIDDQTCDVDYHIDYEFSSYLYQKAASMFMSTIAQGTLDAFEARAMVLKSRPAEAEETAEQSAETAAEEEEQELFRTPEDADPRESARKIYKDRKPGIISKMFKPRRGKLAAAVKHETHINGIIIAKLTELKNSGKLDDLSFYRLIDRFCNDLTIRDQIKNLYSLEKDQTLTEVYFVTYLKELLRE